MLLMDVLPATDKAHRVILLGYGNGGAAPRIERIDAETLLQRLGAFLIWPEQTINRLRDELTRGGRLTNVRLESPTKVQLRRIGFLGL